MVVTAVQPTVAHSTKAAPEPIAPPGKLLVAKAVFSAGRGSVWEAGR
ncbi:hypothetical protein OG604_47730 [Streptomyces sp. NBC_01231]|nr:hypothetical protein OG604_47730 [Streptomyces sp. NBC_01231]